MSKIYWTAMALLGRGNATWTLMSGSRRSAGRANFRRGLHVTVNFGRVRLARTLMSAPWLNGYETMLRAATPHRRWDLF